LPDINSKLDPKWLKWSLWLIGLVIGFRVVYGIFMPLELAGDEAYYWEWSRRPDWSYFSKGPGIAYIIWLSTNLFGHNDFAVRLPALLLSVLTMSSILLICRAMFNSWRTGFFALVVFNCAPVFNAGSMLMTIDNPTFAFWSAGVLAAWWAVTGRGWWAWPLAGVMFGLSLMCKAVAVFFIPALLLFLVLDPKHRPLLKTAGPWVLVVVALLFFTPQVIWNAQNDWTMFRDFLRKGGDSDPWGLAKLVNPPKLIVTQLGILMPLTFGVCVAALVWMARNGKPSNWGTEMRFLGAFSLPVVIFYFLLALNTKINANWMIICYFALVIAGTDIVLRWYDAKRAGLDGDLLERFSRKYKKIALGGALFGAVPSYLLFLMNPVYLIPFPFNPEPFDPTNRLYGWSTMGAETDRIAEQFRDEGPLFYSSRRYMWTAHLAFYTEGQPVTYNFSRSARSNQYFFMTDFDDVVGWNTLFVSRDDDDVERIRHAFEELDFVEHIEIKRGANVIRQVPVYFGRNFQGWQFRNE